LLTTRELTGQMAGSMAQAHLVERSTAPLTPFVRIDPSGTSAVFRKEWNARFFGRSSRT
jgi:hypothetical protein